MNHSVIGLDIAKNLFHIYTIQENGAVFKKMLRRQEMLVFFANYPSSLIGIEACGSSHYWSRELIKLGHDVKLLNARHVKAFVKGNKNDFNDAEAIFDAVSRPNVRTVAVKTVEQQDIQLLHRLRQEATKRRTVLVNQIRGLLSERGIVIAQGTNHVRKRLPELLEDAENALTVLSRAAFSEQYEHLLALDKEIKRYDRQMNQLCHANALSQRLAEVPGIGPLTATIVAADLGEARHYANARHYSASLGIVPRQNSSGGKSALLGISKRGNRYIRTLLIHGARAVLRTCQNKNDKLSLWLQNLMQRRGFNVAAVALANKNARILWALAYKEERYQAAVSA
ncbi:MAG: IS110 family transposase [Methyloglobulus sp.]|nr:IS110 family transposase [Methyloglobulus sp.]